MAALAEPAYAAPDANDEPFADDLMRLIFTCCHPALALDAQIALTLKTLCGLSVEEIARAFLVPPATMAQRLVRAKNKIRAAGIPYEVPGSDRLAERLDGVLRVVYLVFNEGYAATSGDALVRREMCAEGIRLGRLLRPLFPASGEVTGLLALMLLHESRRAARTNADGDLILLEDQDRSLWNGQQIAEGKELVERALASRQVGVYTVQAAISAVHASASSAATTDWRQIVALYDVLMRAASSPVVELNRAVAVAMCDGPEAGLERVDAILARGDLREYHLAHAARADLYRRLGRVHDAKQAYEQALSLAKQQPERRFLEKRLRELG
jgi:RNA polymerase sigma-70 factor (ECF subfamily)